MKKQTNSFYNRLSSGRENINQLQILMKKNGLASSWNHKKIKIIIFSLGDFPEIFQGKNVHKKFQNKHGIYGLPYYHFIFRVKRHRKSYRYLPSLDYLWGKKTPARIEHPHRIEHKTVAIDCKITIPPLSQGWPAPEFPSCLESGRT